MQKLSRANSNSTYYAHSTYSRSTLSLTSTSLSSSNYHLEQSGSIYRVSLTYTKKEIDLIRYTWGKILLDEPLTTSSALPGNFRGAVINLNHNLNRFHSSTISSSLFCTQLYQNLINLDPKLSSRFPLIKHQAVSFAGVLSLAISQLEDLSSLDDYLLQLGKRHSRVLGIEPAEFELMGEAFIQTFVERFGSKFDKELEVLWIKLYLYLANSILQFGIDPIIDELTGTFEENRTILSEKIVKSGEALRSRETFRSGATVMSGRTMRSETSQTSQISASAMSYRSDSTCPSDVESVRSLDKPLVVKKSVDFNKDANDSGSIRRMSVKKIKRECVIA